MDRSANRLGVFFLTTLFRASGLAVVALPVLRYFVPSAPHDAPLLAALALLAVSTLILRAAIRRGRVRVHGTGMAFALLIPALSLAVCAQRTGALESPLLVILGVLVAVAALLLAQLANFVFLAGVSLLVTLLAIVTQQGLVPLAAPTAGEAPATLLVTELGLFVLLGFAVNQLSQQLRDQAEELHGNHLRDAATGTLRATFFQTRLVALLEEHRGQRGVLVAVFELPDAAPTVLHETGALLLESVRGSDITGRLSATRFAVAAPTYPEDAAYVARRLTETLTRLGLGVQTGHAYRLVEGDEDAVQCAAELLATAEEAIAKEPVGFAEMV